MKICNINIIIKKKGVETDQMAGFLTSATLDSFMSNRDADGVYFSSSNKLVKGSSKINICEFGNSIKKSKFILTHQRISTSGLEEQYAQPFRCEEEGFVLLHNGIINDFQGKKGSDTYGYFYNHFLVAYKDIKGSREKKIIKAIKETMKDCEGSYSIGIYDMKKEKLYYFKSSSRDISFYKSDDDKILYITTKDSNKKYLEFFYRDFSEMTIDDEKIYRISVGKKIEVKKVGKIPEKPTKRFFTHSTKSNIAHRRNVGYNPHEDNAFGNRAIHGGNEYDKRKLEDLARENRKGVHNIFQEDKNISKKENERLGLMHDKLWNGTNRETWDRGILEEILDTGTCLLDMGFCPSYTDEVCSNCIKKTADFLDQFGLPICEDCIGEIAEDINEQMETAHQYLKYGGLPYYEGF